MTRVNGFGSATLPVASMFLAARGITVTVCLLTLLGYSSAHAQADSLHEPGPLSFRGFVAGESLAAVAGAIRQRKAPGLRCTHSRTDASVLECRTIFTDATDGARIEVWLSAIDSVTGILSLKSSGTPAQLEAWRSELRLRYGAVETKLQGPQRMMQWVRRGRMIRLTWRVDGPGPTMSVSLVDGHVLDAWGQRKRP
ncbi:MAG: hypothetical protein ABI679_14740 [Gemmatimonadota bacterium]